MQIEEILTIMSPLLHYSFEAAIAGGIAFFLIKHFLPGYLNQKGKNLATQEDIQSITDKVESVKSGYAEVLEEVKSNNQIKIAAIEREKALKKEVYMEAVEAITIIQSVISKLANLNLTEGEIGSEFSECSGRIAKIQLVGERETVKAVTIFTAAIGKAFLDLMLERTPLMRRKIKIEIAQVFMNKHQVEIDRYRSLMKSMNVDGQLDQRTKAHINKCMLFEVNQREQYNEELESFWEVQNKEHLMYTKTCMDRFFEISLLLPSTVLSVRKELDLEIEAEDYENIFNDNINKGREAFDNFFVKASS